MKLSEILKNKDEFIKNIVKDTKKILIQNNIKLSDEINEDILKILKKGEKVKFNYEKLINIIKENEK